ncbi:MAG: Nif11-like leader peptide family natural product precursor [Chlorobiaceae bacterium]|nr:Nif11-like leader peptide family natural product precursor [Chlorobiaceae bacterium]
MSVEQAKAFIEKMKTDEAFREKVMAIEDTAGRIACIRGEGFECTEEEINEVAQEVRDDSVLGAGIDNLRITCDRLFPIIGCDGALFYLC